MALENKEISSFHFFSFFVHFYGRESVWECVYVCSGGDLLANYSGIFYAKRLLLCHFQKLWKSCENIFVGKEIEIENSKKKNLRLKFTHKERNKKYYM